ncbi:ABC transporter permease [Kribbella sp. NPDC026596]|uniref:ABC transporter permease n=1 Tax=Kribbella sp. NPDC026596 TaxID=3155122 RepID=UPI0033DDD8FA
MKQAGAGTPGAGTPGGGAPGAGSPGSVERTASGADVRGMSPRAAAVRAGWRRGVIELRQSFTNGGELFSHFLWPVLMLAALFFLRHRDFGSTGFLLGALALPSILGMNAAMGMVSMSQQLTADREDGTLLRAKAIPNGMLGYLVGKVVSVAGGLLADLAILLIPGLLIVDGLALGSAHWPTLGWVLLLGLIATLPIGAILGSVFTTARAQGLIQLPVLALIAISGIFYPITALPGWLEWIGQLTPIYWMGLGMRSALLPNSAVVVELGDSWRHVETVGVLGIWAVGGLLLAPVVLRRMARRESGSKIAERRERALQRVA